MSVDHGASTAAALRRAFDERFAAEPPPPPDAAERLLVVALGDARAALRLGDLTGLQAAPTLVRVPDGAPGLLGLAGIRGSVVPVFDLASLAGASAPPHPRGGWIVLAGTAPRVGLHVAAALGWIDVARASIVALGEGDAGHRHLRELAIVPGSRIAIVDVPAVLRELAARSGAKGGPP
jgi:purine-binding chemotaxis protein CheW